MIHVHNVNHHVVCQSIYLWYTYVICGTVYVPAHHEAQRQYYHELMYERVLDLDGQGIFAWFTQLPG